MMVPLICTLLSCPTIGPKVELGWGTEATEVVGQSHLQLQLALPGDVPGWRGSRITSPDRP